MTKARWGERQAPEAFWTEEKIADLKRMICVEGMTYAEAGRCLGCIKSAAIGKSHRLYLARNPDAPISHFQRATLAGLMARYHREPTVKPTSDIFPSTGRCVFPLGHPGHESFHFCSDRVASPGAPYCDDHRRLTHVSVAKSEAQTSAWTEERRIRLALQTRQRVTAEMAAE